VFSKLDHDLIMPFNPLEGGEMVKLLQAAIYLNLKHFKSNFYIIYKLKAFA